LFVGLSADLKRRYGDGFKLSFHLSTPAKEQEAHAFVLSLIPHATLVHKLASTYTYHAPRGDIPLHELFIAMENSKAKVCITDWAATNSTLEEVFLAINSETALQSSFFPVSPKRKSKIWNRRSNSQKSQSSISSTFSSDSEATSPIIQQTSESNSD
jgi:hypothetical protein